MTVVPQDPGFTSRSTFDGNLLEDNVAGAAGSYAATGTANGGGWFMQMVALKPASVPIAGDHQRLHRQRPRRERFLVSDHDHEFTHQLWRHGIARRASGKQRHRVDLRHPHRGRNLQRDPERHQQCRYRHCHTNPEHQRAASAHHQRLIRQWDASRSAFSYQITALNAPSSYGAAGLPAGLSVNTATGLISGTPTAAGTSNVTLSATNSGGIGNATLTLTVNPAAPVITSATSATGTVGTAFTYQITASNSPTSFGATGLPAGLTVNTASGSITGTPSVSGTSTVTLSATNAGGTGNATLALTINPAASGGSVTLTPASIAFGSCPVRHKLRKRDGHAQQHRQHRSEHLQHYVHRWQRVRFQSEQHLHFLARCQRELQHRYHVHARRHRNPHGSVVSR